MEKIFYCTRFETHDKLDKDGKPVMVDGKAVRETLPLAKELPDRIGKLSDEMTSALIVVILGKVTLQNFGSSLKTVKEYFSAKRNAHSYRFETENAPAFNMNKAEIAARIANQESMYKLISVVAPKVYEETEE